MELHHRTELPVELTKLELIIRCPLSSGFNEHHRFAFNVLVDSLYFLLGRGLLEDLRRMVPPGSLIEDETRKLLQVIEDFLEHEQTRGHARVNERAVAYIRGVQEWSDLFRPTDFVGKLREVCARSLWDQRFSRDVSRDRDETDDLAALVVQQPGLLAPELDWLASPEAESAERFGFALGRIDTTGNCGRMIFEYATAHKAVSLLRGYVRGMVHVARRPPLDFLEFMTKLEATQPELAVDILTVAGDSFQAFPRIVRLVEALAVAPRFLARLAMGLGGRDLTADEVNRLLPFFTRAASAGDGDSACAGIRFLETYLLLESRHATQTCLTLDTIRSLAWQLVETALPYLAGQSVREWGEILKTLAAFEPDRATNLLGRALLAENVMLEREAEEELTQLANTNPESVMVGLGSALLDPKHGWRLQVHVCRDLVGRLPANVVINWVRNHGLHAARAVARHLPPPYLDAAGNPVVPQVLDTILRDYDDDKVVANFLAGAHSGEVWWGNAADQFRRAAEHAKQFLNSPNRRIRAWAENEISFRLHLAEVEEREHEEQFLPP